MCWAARWASCATPAFTGRRAEDRKASRVRFDLPSELHQPVQILGCLAQREKRLEFVDDHCPVEGSALPHQDAVHVHPILCAASEGLQHHKILRGASVQHDAWRKFPVARPFDAAFLERQGAERNIDADRASTPEQQDSALQRELTRSFDAWFELRKQAISGRAFAAERTEQRDVYIACSSRL